jgi:hypothetical protein
MLASAFDWHVLAPMIPLIPRCWPFLFRLYLRLFAFRLTLRQCYHPSGHPYV